MSTENIGREYIHLVVMKVYLFLRAVSDFDLMKIQVLGYDDMSTGILEP